MTRGAGALTWTGGGGLTLAEGGEQQTADAAAHERSQGSPPGQQWRIRGVDLQPTANTSKAAQTIRCMTTPEFEGTHAWRWVVRHPPPKHYRRINRYT